MEEAALKAYIETALDNASRSASTNYVTPTNVRGSKCTVESCNRPEYSSGYCNAHYIRVRAGKSLDAPIRVRKRLDECSECGNATGSKGGWGLCSNHFKQRRHKVIKTALIEALGGRCKHCENVFPSAVYDFHHVGIKTDSPGTLISSGSVDRIAKEISKCVLLCANCHRIEHNE